MLIASSKQASSPVVIPLVVASALLMETLDSTILTTAIPAIAHDFGVDPVRLKMVLTAYLVSLAVFVPASGWFADRFGPRTVLLAAIATFTSASLLCALSQTLAQLIAARVLQGVGGAMLLPVARLVVVRSTERNNLVAALSWITIPALIGPIVGPPLGGVAVSYATWHWIFLINIPIGLTGMILCWRLLPKLPAVQRRFDWLGFLLSGTALSLIVVTTSLLGTGGALFEDALLSGVTAVFLMWIFIRRARDTPQPILDLGLLRMQTLRASLLGGTFFRIGVGAMPFLLPLFLQIGFHLSALASGCITFAAGAGALLMKFTVTPILRAFGYRRVLLVNGAASSLMMAAPILFSPSWPLWIMTVVLFTAGFLRSLQFTALNALTFAETDDDQAASVTTLSAVAQQIAASLGVSFAAALLQLTRGSSTSPLTIHDFDVAFGTLAFIAALSVLSFVMLPRTAGQQLM